MNLFFWSTGASLLVSLISLVGILSFFLKNDRAEKTLLVLVGFSAGTLIGGALLHLLPEALEKLDKENVFILVIIGFILFFILERYIHWRHCHKEHCDIHSFTYLNLIGDGIHNFADGLVISTSFFVGIPFGVITTLMIIFHEIPQEIGDFAVLIYGGWKKTSALIFNFLSALSCVLGAWAGFLFAGKTELLIKMLFPLVAGGFIYIAACDLIPEMHKEQQRLRGVVSTLAFICGILFIIVIKRILPH